MFRPNARTPLATPYPQQLEMGRRNFNLEEFISSLPVKSVNSSYEVNKTHQLVSDAMLKGLIPVDCIMSTTRNMYPPLTLNEPSFIPYHLPPIPYNDFSHIPRCIPMDPVDSWHSMHGLYPTTCNTGLPLHHKDPAVPHFIRPKRPLESKITWSAAYMDYNYNPPVMTLAGPRPYTHPRTFGYPRQGFNSCAQEIVPSVIPDGKIAPLPRIFPQKSMPTDFIMQKPIIAPGSNSLALSQPVLPPPTLAKTEDKKKAVTYRFVYPKAKKYGRIKSKKLLTCNRNISTRAKKLVLSLTKPLLDCHRKGLDCITRNIPIEASPKMSPESGSPKTMLSHDLLAVAMLTKCLHFEHSKCNPLHPLKRYVVQEHS